MDCVCSNPRMNAEEEEDCAVTLDRIIMLADDVIHKILSFVSIKHAIRTSCLSSRWRFLWTSMPHLNLSTDDFESVYGLPSHRVFDYAFVRTVKELTVSCLHGENIDFPIKIFRSQSLQYLKFTGYKSSFRDSFLNTIDASSWELPRLTTLHLENVAIIEDSVFSKCANLKKLILNNFTILEGDSFTLCHPGLSDLTLEYNRFMRPINVVTPQLKNLILRNVSGERLVTVTTPNLASLLFHGSRLLQFSTDLPSLEKVDLCIFPCRNVWSCSRVTALLQELHNAKFLTLNVEFVKPLNSYMEGNSLQVASPFSNLKSLKIYPNYLPSDERKKISITPKVINYFIDGSLNATFTLISYEEIKEKRRNAEAFANANAAQNLMASFKVMLEKEKATVETRITWTKKMLSREENSTDKEDNDTDDQGKPSVQKMRGRFHRKMAQMKRCIEDVSAQINQGQCTFSFILSQLRDIEFLDWKLTSLLQRGRSCKNVFLASVRRLILSRRKYYTI